MKILLLILAVLLSSVTSKATDVVLPDTPNLGDTTTISTVTTGNLVTSGNLISQDFDDGTWNGTIFPDNSDLNHSTWLTGKENTYAETVVNSTDYLTIEELRQGFTSNFTADIRWWNSVESTVTMSQTATNGVDTTTQSTTFVDTTNHNYQLNNYGNTLIMNADPNMTHGVMTYRFDFDIINNKQASYNGGHAGVDVTNPLATVDYSALSSTTVTTVEYCWEKTPSTCPATEELAAVEEIIQNIPEEFFVPEDFFTPEEFIVYAIPETIVAYIPEEIELEDDFEPVMYDLPVMEINMEEMQIENFEVEVMTMDATDMMPNFENIEVFEQELSMPQDNYFDSVPTDMDMFDIAPMDTEVLVEMFTAEPEFVEEPMLEEAPIEIIEEPMVEEVSEPVVMASAEPIIEDKPMQEIVMEEEPIDEPEIEEQSSSEELVADEPVSEPETTEQEEIIEEPVEAKIESKPEPTVEEDIVTEKPKIDIANIERVIKEQVTNKIQQVTATLDVVNEVLSREMTANQPDLSAYTALNNAMIDNRQLPGGNPAFFNQVALVGYDKTIYQNQISMATIDPVAQHEVKMDVARDKTNKAYFKLKALLEARQ